MPALRLRLLWQALAVVGTAGLMLVLRVMEPVFWFQDDKRNQYIPVVMDIGRRLRDGELPVIDPDLGISGNYALDLQYGIYEPTHWLVAVGLSTMDNLALAGFLWALLYLLILAWGVTALSQRLGASGGWAAAAGIAVATSGYVFYWLAPNWIPGIASLAWLPWLWWAWAAPLIPRRCVAIAIFAYLAVAGGWPATWIMLAALALGFLVETVGLRDRTAPWLSWAAPLGLRALATLGGLLPAALTVLPLARAAEFTTRNATVDNRNFLVANLADIISFAAPALHGDLATFGDQTTVTIPIYFVAWFALPLLWLVDWRTSLARAPGVVTGAVGLLVMVMATQLPDTLGPLRDSIRGLAGAQLFFVVTVVAIACSAPLVVSRRRAVGIGVSLLLMAALTWFRDPSGVVGVLGVAAVGIGVVVLTGLVSRGRFAVAGVVAAAATLVFSGLAFGLNEVRASDQQVPSTLEAGALTFTAADAPMLAIYPAAPLKAQQTFYADGVGRAFQRLSEDTRVSPGYSSIRQRYFTQRFCTIQAKGDSCGSVVERLFEPEKLTGLPWIDLLGYQTVVVTGKDNKPAFAERADPDWRKVDAGKVFDEYQRTEPAAVAGRVTAVIGEADVTAVEVSNQTQSYDVSSADGATLVFRDLYWPGYHATLDGRSLPVRALQRTLVSVTLPPGAQGRLTVSYRPLPTVYLAGLPLVGAGLVGLAMLGAWQLQRRRRAVEVPASAGVDRDGGEREPDDGEHLQHPV